VVIEKSVTPVPLSAAWSIVTGTRSKSVDCGLLAVGPILKTPSISKSITTDPIAAAWSLVDVTLVIVPPAGTSLDYRVEGRTHWVAPGAVLAYLGEGRLQANSGGRLHLRCEGRTHWDGEGRLHYLGEADFGFDVSPTLVGYRGEGSVSFDASGEAGFATDTNQLTYETVQ
tara:strand:- start:628 stop:1140 length:513 start_codon:yes stop_codon:yes gene_type:complete